MSDVGTASSHHISSHPACTSHPILRQAKVVKEFPEDGVLAADLSFPSGFWLVPPRQARIPAELWLAIATEILRFFSRKYGVANSI